MCGNNDGNICTTELYILRSKHNRISTIEMPAIYVLLNWKLYLIQASLRSRNLKHIIIYIIHLYWSLKHYYKIFNFYTWSILLLSFYIIV